MKKRNLFVAIALTASMTPMMANAEPFSTWQGEHEHKGKEFTTHHAKQGPLPYDGLVSEYYYGTSPKAINTQMRVAASFEEGINGVTKNKHEAANWYNVAAEHGQAEAQFKIYEYSRDVNGGQANEDGLYWLQRSAEQNNPNALFHSGERIFDMDGSEIKLLEAKGFFERAGAVGHPLARQRVKQIEHELTRRHRKEAWDDFWGPYKVSEY